MRQVKIQLALLAIRKTDQFLLYLLIIEIGEFFRSELPPHPDAGGVAEFIIITQIVILQQAIYKTASIAAEIVFIFRNGSITVFPAMVAMGCNGILGSFFRWRFNQGHSGGKGPRVRLQGI